MRTKIARVSKFVHLMAISCQIMDMKNSRGQHFIGVDKKNDKVVIFVQLVAISVQIVDMEYSTQQKWTR